MVDEDERIVRMRLQKFLARAGVASRRGSENLMTQGRVTVNGQVVRELGSKVDPLCDVVRVDGHVVRMSDGHVYLVLNKPNGVLTTMSDPYERPCVADLVPHDRYPGLFPVGRLDLDTTGILLFTTDGELAANLLHPSCHVEKVYHALLDSKMSTSDIDRFCAGLELDDGLTAPAKLRRLSPAEAHELYNPGRAAQEDMFEVILHEGRKRQVKRMFSALGHPVTQLKRVRFGPIEAPELALGTWRFLTTLEIDALKACVHTGTKTREEQE